MRYTNSDTARALVLSALMVLSVMAGTVAFAGAAAAATDPVLEGTTPANGSIIHGTTTLTFDAASPDGAELAEVQFDVYGPGSGSVGDNWVYDDTDGNVDRIDFNLPANESVIQEAMDNPTTTYSVLDGYSLDTVQQTYGITYIEYDNSTESWSVTINASHDFWSTGEWDWLVKVVDENGNVSAHNNFNANPNDQDVVTYHVESIQSAVNAADAGDVVEAPPGTYTETVTIDKPLTVTGAGATLNGQFHVNAGPTTIRGFEVGHFEATTPTQNNEGVHIAASDVLVEDVTVTNISGVGWTEVEGVHIFSASASNITIRGLTTTGLWSEYAGADGVKVQGKPNDVTITQSSFDGIDGWWSYGVSVTPGDPAGAPPTNVVIESNTFGTITTHGGDGGAAPLWGVGVGIDTWNGTPFVEPGANASEVVVTGNDFTGTMDAGVLNKDNRTVVAEHNDWGGHPTIGSYAGQFENWTRGDVVGAVDFDPWVGEPTPTPVTNEVHDHHHHQASGGGGGSSVVTVIKTVEGPSPTPREVVRTEIVERTVVHERTVVVEGESPTPREVERTVIKTVTPGQPGFGIVVAIVALLGAALLALRSRD